MAQINSPRGPVKTCTCLILTFLLVWYGLLVIWNIFVQNANDKVGSYTYMKQLNQVPWIITTKCCFYFTIHFKFVHHTPSCLWLYVNDHPNTVWYYYIFVLFKGSYWIDPNDGLPNDAIKVRCEYHTKSTCLYPVNNSEVISVLFLLCFFAHGPAKSTLRQE